MKDSFAEHLLEYPHYTRPHDLPAGRRPNTAVRPPRRDRALEAVAHQLQSTSVRRPDLFGKLELSAEDWKLFNGPEPAAPVDEKRLRRNAKIVKITRIPMALGYETIREIEREEIERSRTLCVRHGRGAACP